jgi:signal transduction histidine kinase
MRYVQWTRTRTGRLLTILLVGLIYLLLLAVDGLRFFPYETSHNVSLLLAWLSFGFSELVALLFLAVGALVWLYTRNRLVALVLFGFTFAMMTTFAMQTGDTSGDPLLSTISVISGALALLLFATLLLLFPRNHFALSGDQHRSHREQNNILLLRGYLVVLTFLAAVVVLQDIFNYLQLSQLAGILFAIGNIYYVLALAGIITTIITSYRRTSSLRERQQHRLFVVGVILATTPLLLLTVLPLVLNLPGIDGQWTTITLVLLPFALGYSILRYQILIFDAYIRRAAAWIVGVVYLALLGFVVIAISNLPLTGHASTAIIYFAIAIALLGGPVVWWLAHLVTDHLFFSEIKHYRRIVDQPGQLTREKLDSSDAARLITMAATSVFGTQEACLYVLDDDTGHYQLYPPLADDDASDAPRRSFIQRLLQAMSPAPLTISAVDVPLPLLQDTHWLSLHWLIMDLVERIAGAARPLLLSEAARPEAAMPAGLARYLMTRAPREGFDPLLAPIRAQGKIIAVLVLGERGDHGQYAGPDFEAIALIEERYSPVLETARLDAQASRHVAILDALYSGVSAASGAGKAFQSADEVADAYTKIAAEAAQARAETWLYHASDGQLRHIIHVGPGPQLLSSDSSMSPRDSDWSSLFYHGEGPKPWQGSSSEIPSCLPQIPHFPFAWLPLKGGKQHVGTLALTYSRSHLFSQEEQRVLSMFADQFAVALENASFTVELRAAYERQKELDRLKDQFIITASHELRTPLTAVQGYIELLNTYNHNLSPERRAEFIMKAHRGCDELTLLVENIMDASRLQVDTENLNISQIPLAEPVRHITEILEGVTRQERRSINVAVPGDVYVMADELRLRQVLLNLVSNALKYSPPQSDVDITASMNDGNVNVSIRDRGKGVPLQDQARLFKRFVRLERDMNSPIRGAGLGLYISKRLIETMGGRIWVESTGKVGEGSIFTFTLKRVMLTQEMSESALVERQQAL